MFSQLASRLRLVLVSAVLGLSLAQGAVAQGTAPASAPEAATAAAVAPSAKPATAKVDNPYGIGALWEGSDFVAKGVLLIMAVMSMGSWYI
ncbi:MAG: hypothetical protein RLZZ584_4271, partial [Pseudomonadota bacterium]